MSFHNTPFTPDDPDHLHAGQVWSHEDGRECTVLHVFDGSSLSRGGGLAQVQMGRETIEVAGLDPDDGGTKIVRDSVNQRLFSGRCFEGMKISECVRVRRVALLVRGEMMMLTEVDRSCRWVVKDGVGRFERDPGETG